MKPCAVHNVMMSGKGTATECTHLVCDKCVEENERLRKALEKADMEVGGLKINVSGIGLIELRDFCGFQEALSGGKL